MAIVGDRKNRKLLLVTNHDCKQLQRRKRESCEKVISVSCNPCVLKGKSLKLPVEDAQQRRERARQLYAFGCGTVNWPFKVIEGMKVMIYSTFLLVNCFGG